MAQRVSGHASVVPAAPRISVVLPYRDAESTIEEAIDSVLAQSLGDVQVVAVDDGSRDGSTAIVTRLAARHGGLDPIALPPSGIVAALSAGMGAARSPLIARMDADDWSHPQRFAHQLELLRETQAAVVGCRVEGFGADGVGEGMRRYIEWQNSLLSADDHAREIFVESPLCHPSVVARREVLQAVGGWRDVDWAEDYDLWLRLDAAGYPMVKVPEVLFRWRQSPGQLTFRDARYSKASLRRAKAPHLARRLRALGRPVIVWGAGPTGRRMVRELEPEGVAPRAFIDIDPEKIGRRARGVRIVSPHDVDLSVATVVVAVAARGARDEIRRFLRGRGSVEGRDYLCAA